MFITYLFFFWPAGPIFWQYLESFGPFFIAKILLILLRISEKGKGQK